MNDPVGNLSNQWTELFKRCTSYFEWQPTQQRSCTDPLSLLLLIMITIGAIILIGQAPLNQNPINSASQMYNITLWMMILSLASALILTLLIRSYAESAITIMGLLSIIVTIGLAIELFYSAQTVLAIVVGLWATILMCVYYCQREQIEKSIILIKMSSYLLTEESSIMWVAVLLSVAAGVLGLFILSAWSQFTGSLSSNMQGASTQIIGLALLLLFVTMLSYYSFVFIVGWVAAEWHYTAENSQPCVGFWSFLKYHTGSTTLIAVLAPPLKIIQLLILSTKPHECFVNPCSQLIICMLRCCLNSLEYFAFVIGKSAVVMMSLTGDNLITSSRNAGVVLVDQRLLFSNIESISSSILAFQLTITTGNALLVGIYLSPTFNTYQIISIIAAVFLLSTMVSVSIASCHSQSIHALFLLDSLDIKIQKYGRSKPISHQLHDVATTLCHQSFMKLREIDGIEQPLIDHRELQAIDKWQHQQNNYNVPSNSLFRPEQHIPAANWGNHGIYGVPEAYQQQTPFPRSDNLNHQAAFLFSSLVPRQ